MACTTVLVGKGASWDGSTLIARNDDGHYDEKRLIVVLPEHQPKTYRSKRGHLVIDLPADPLRYTATPNVNGSDGVWAANGINEANVAMTATETITSNPRVLGADPLVAFQKRTTPRGKDTPGGIGEEDIVSLVLPYIRTAREGVERLGMLLETYGTYESNGIAFSDVNEIWWMETIGGHHWIARRVPDDHIVLMPNRFGLDSFDLDDAFGKQENHLCSSDLRDFIRQNHLDLNTDGVFDPRWVFGSHTDADHVYNTPRAWDMGRYFAPATFRWYGPDADFTPESNNIPWALVPEKKVTVEDVKYILSSHFQGTPYDPYGRGAAEEKGKYRPIGINRTSVMAVLQLRGYMPEDIAAVEWICFGANPFNAMIPVYAHTSAMPAYLAHVTMDVSTDNFYWASRLVGAMADANYGACIQLMERYQNAMASGGHRLLNEYDAKMLAAGRFDLIAEANAALAGLARKETSDILYKVLYEASVAMKCGYKRADN